MNKDTKTFEFKNNLRIKNLELRSLMTREEVEVYSNRIVKRIMACQLFIDCDQVFCYFPLGNEIDLKPLIGHCQSANKKIAFPKVIGKDEMVFIEVEDVSEFEQGTFKVMEPTGKKVITPTSKSLILLPGLAFDSDLNRIGFGAGYYDKYLNESLRSNVEHEERTVQKEKPFIVGTFYEWQRVAEIKTFMTDVKLDCIITELNIYK